MAWDAGSSPRGHMFLAKMNAVTVWDAGSLPLALVVATAQVLYVLYCTVLVVSAQSCHPLHVTHHYKHGRVRGCMHLFHDR